MKHWNAGAFVEFETNRGRIFTFKSHLTSQMPDEMTTFNAKAGNEIICLKVNIANDLK